MAEKSIDTVLNGSQLSMAEELTDATLNRSQLSMAEKSTDTVLNGTQLSAKSQSLLPQGHTQDRRNSHSESTCDESSLELSGFSNIMPSGSDYSSETGDPFNSVFYRVIPSEGSTHIHFYARPLFKTIMSVLEKEFRTPGDDVSKFLLKTHIQGKKCHIHVDRSDLTIVATGPGHVTWKENSFRKMTMNMYKKFVDKTNSFVNSQADTSVEYTASSSNHQVVNTQAQMLGLLETTSATDSPVLKNISMLMDMIHTLQGQVTKLTAEVNKLVIQASDPLYQTVSETYISGNKEISDNAVAVDQSVPNTINHDETTDEIEPNRVLNHSFTDEIEPNRVSNHSFTGDNVKLTSTPRPKQHQPSGHRSSSNASSREPQPATRPRPVPKPRTSLQQSQTSPKKILLIGDSLISGINKNGLKDNVYKHGISGATVDTVLNELLVYDLHRFSHAIIYVGGNDASKRTDIEYFEEKYEQLLVHIKENSKCKILLVNSCPRGDVDTGEVNEIIQGLKEHHKLELVDVHKAFFNRKGELIRRYYSRDSIHLSDSGVKRLLETIDNKVNIVEDFSRCVFNTIKQTGRKPSSRTRRIHYQQQGDVRINPCMKCGENNHETRDCKHTEQLKCHYCGYYGHKSRRCGNH